MSITLLVILYILIACASIVALGASGEVEEDPPPLSLFTMAFLWPLLLPLGLLVALYYIGVRIRTGKW